MSTPIQMLLLNAKYNEVSDKSKMEIKLLKFETALTISIGFYNGGYFVAFERNV